MDRDEPISHAIGMADTNGARLLDSVAAALDEIMDVLVPEGNHWPKRSAQRGQRRTYSS
jgi:hypothetical protein